MDSFEAKLQFSQMLKTLTASSQNLVKCANFAIFNQDLQEYLHSCILEVLDSTDLNTRSNILNFIEILIQRSFFYSEQPKSNYKHPYLSLIQTSFPEIIEKMLPSVTDGLVNLSNTFNTLKSISKTFGYDYESHAKEFNSNLLTEQDKLNVKDNVPFEPLKENSGQMEGAWQLLINKKKQSQYERALLLAHGPIIQTEGINMLGVHEDPEVDLEASQFKLTKRQILGRMEADREGHKRAKEGLWIIERPKGTISEDEFIKNWEKFRAFDNDDYDDFGDLNRIANQSYTLSQFQ